MNDAVKDLDPEGLDEDEELEELTQEEDVEVHIDEQEDAQQTLPEVTPETSSEYPTRSPWDITSEAITRLDKTYTEMSFCRNPRNTPINPVAWFNWVREIGESVQLLKDAEKEAAVRRDARRQLKKDRKNKKNRG